MDAAGGSVSSRTLSVVYGEKYTLPTPTREGYLFKGWYSGGERVTSGTYKRDGNLSLTASWEFIPVVPPTLDEDASTTVQ